ncbi:MAG: hypothetical protein HPY45_17340 [Anaerolineae bacterium]|nr:hypothetical protein [Anaerolineae bacterium]
MPVGVARQRWRMVRGGARQGCGEWRQQVQSVAWRGMKTGSGGGSGALRRSPTAAQEMPR